MNKVFWLREGILAGRPGPDREPWDPAQLSSGGIGAVLSVNGGLLCHEEDFAPVGISYACVALSANAPPRPGDEQVCMEVLPRAYAFVHDQVTAGRAVLVHCSSGKDRTGLFLSYFLMRAEGLTPREAIAAVRAVRPIALSAEGWEEFGARVLAALE